RMLDVDLARQVFAANGLMKKSKRVERFAASFDDAIDSELVVHVGLNNLPATRAAYDYLEVVSIRAVLNLEEHVSGVVRIDRHLGGTEDRGVNTRGKGDSQRIVSRDRNDTSVWSNKLVK